MNAASSLHPFASGLHPPTSNCIKFPQVMWPTPTNPWCHNWVNHVQPTVTPYHITKYNHSHPLPIILGQYLDPTIKSFVLMQIWISHQNPGFWLVQSKIIAFSQPVRTLPIVQGHSLSRTKMLFLFCGFSITHLAGHLHKFRNLICQMWQKQKRSPIVPGDMHEILKPRILVNSSRLCWLVFCLWRTTCWTNFWLTVFVSCTGLFCLFLSKLSERVEVSVFLSVWRCGQDCMCRQNAFSTGQLHLRSALPLGDKSWRCKSFQDHEVHKNKKIFFKRFQGILSLASGSKQKKNAATFSFGLPVSGILRLGFCQERSSCAFFLHVIILSRVFISGVAGFSVPVGLSLRLLFLLRPSMQKNFSKLLSSLETRGLRTQTTCVELWQKVLFIHLEPRISEFARIDLT